MTKSKVKSYKFGILAEMIAIVFLWLKGYKILKNRYKTFVGEIDIIACKGDFLIAIEVKARKNITTQNGFLIDEVVSKNQRQRIKRAIISFLKSNQEKYFRHNIRFDLIVVRPYRIPLHFLGFWD